MKQPFSFLEPNAKRPWYAHYDEAMPHDITVPEGPITDLLDEAAGRWPKRVAVAFQNQSITFAGLKKKAEIFAASLRRHGVGKGDRVAIMLPNLPQSFIAFWGVQKAGAVAVMTNPLYMESELTHLVKDAGVEHMILLDVFWSKISSLRESLGLKVCYVTRIMDSLDFPMNWLQAFSARRNGSWVDIPFDGRGVVRWKDMLSGSERLSDPAENPAETPAVIQYTGGTTGRSKGAILTHRNFQAQVEQTCRAQTEEQWENQVMLALMPLFHVFGLTLCLLLAVRIGCKVVPMPRYVQGDMLEAFKKYHFTFFPGAPSVYISLLQQKNLDKESLRDIRLCISGSAPMPLEWMKRFEEVTGVSIIEGFGLTEASPVTHLNPPHGVHKAGSIGCPLPGTDARIVDMKDGVTVLPPGQSGELVIRGPQVMQGYWNQPEETAATLVDGWLHTGDIATMDEDGYFYILDRKKDLIIVGGYNVYPREIDEVLHQHPKIREAVAVGVSHRSRGETIKAYIVPKEGETLTVPEVVSFCRKKLASYKVPRLIEFREELPKSLVGKVLRRVLREEEERRSAEEAGQKDA